MKSVIEKIREEFPALQQTSHGVQIVYLDNAATSQKPSSVIALINNINSRLNANVHRSMYELSDRVTELYEESRLRVMNFMGTTERESIVFTAGTTAAINLVASSLGQMVLNKGDIIVIGGDNHHSNIVPWQLVAQKYGAEIRVIPVDKNGELDLADIENIIDERVKIVAISHISNITGIINPIKEIIELTHRVGGYVLIDGAQGAVHEEINVTHLDTDFYTFSTHKLYGGTGHGILYGKKSLLEQMPPYMGGGDMVDKVTYQQTTYAKPPLKFEAGTPNFTSAISLIAALEWVKKIREEQPFAQEVIKEQKAIVDFMFDALENEVGDVEIYGNPQQREKKIALFSFNIKGINSSDIAQLLDQFGIAVRSGLMCAEPLLNSFNASGAVRASFAPYNTIDEARILITSLKRVKQMLF